MFRNYFKTAYRQLLNNKLFSIVNIVGLSVGLASIMALSVLIYQYVTTDSIQKDIDQMYYLKTSESTATTYPLLGEIVKTAPEVEGATHIQSWSWPWLKFNNKDFQGQTDYVDTAYFKVFQLPFKYGNPSTAMQDKFSLVLSAEMAEKMFGNTDPVGKTVIADDSVYLKVTGVLEHVPSNSTIKPNILLTTALLMANPDFRENADWYNTFANNYLRLKRGSDPKNLDKKIADIVQLNYSKDHKDAVVYTVPFSKISDENSSIIKVIIKGSVGAGLFILLIILVNLINLNTATMYSRAKEVAVRQMIGSSKRNIVIQFCIENGLIVLISTLFSWIIFSLLLFPQVNDLVKDKFGEIETGISGSIPLIIFFTGVGLLFTVLAASIPAWKLAALKVTDTVKNKISSGNLKGNTARNIFITVQFSLAITLICVTIILNRQINYMKSVEPGFNTSNVAIARIGLSYLDPKAAAVRFESILSDLKNNPHVRAVSTSRAIPTAYDDNFNIYVDPITQKESTFRQTAVGEGYLPTFQISLVEGKNFDDQLAASQENAVLINRAGMKAMGWTTAVGKQITPKGESKPYTVIGVMEDFHFTDLQKPIDPLIQAYSGKASIQNRYLSVRTDAGYLMPVMHELEAEFKNIPSRRDFTYELLSDKVDKQYKLFDGILKATNYVALLTIIIACMGMFGLIALFAKQRIKEIGIRKVLGASVQGIVQLLSKDFMLLVVVSIVIATPIAWYIMNNWLQDFAYKIEIKWWMFAAAGMLSILIALITVGVQAFKAAIANPVKSLRSE